MKVLIVDDSKIMRRLVRKTLTAAVPNELAVEEATNGLEALSMIDTWKPDLVLTDWNMPEMTGIELIEMIKEKALNVKVGLITSQGTKAMKQRAKDAGAMFLIHKPFTPERIAEAIGPMIK